MAALFPDSVPASQMWQLNEPPPPGPVNGLFFFVGGDPIHYEALAREQGLTHRTMLTNPLIRILTRDELRLGDCMGEPL
jgi:hypothetical protein